MFMRTSPFSKQGFDVPFQFPEDDKPFLHNSRILEQEKRMGQFLSYKVQVAAVSGPFSDIVELFVRINSTGKPLTSSEKRHARFYKSPFLQEADRLARRDRPFLMKHGVISRV